MSQFVREARASMFRLCIGLLLVQFTMSAQESPPLIRSNSRLVVLDVVVTGKDGRPIVGLKKDSFTVTENGVPQKLSSFEEHRPQNRPLGNQTARRRMPRRIAPSKLPVSTRPGDASETASKSDSPRRIEYPVRRFGLCSRSYCDVP